MMCFRSECVGEKVPKTNLAETIEFVSLAGALKAIHRYISFVKQTRRACEIRNCYSSFEY